MYEDQEYHRRRAEMEMEEALRCGAPSAAVRHLELARMHRSRREEIAEEARRQRAALSPPRIIGTDKEA